MAVFSRLGYSGYGTRRTGSFFGKTPELPAFPTLFTYADVRLEPALSVSASLRKLIDCGEIILEASVDASPALIGGGSSTRHSAHLQQ